MALLIQKQMEAILNLRDRLETVPMPVSDKKISLNEKQLRQHYLDVFNRCFDQMFSRASYGTDEDLLKSIKEMDISDLGSMIKTKGIRIKNTDDMDSIEDSLIDVINYAIDGLRRLQ